MSLPDFFAALGTDHYLSPQEVAVATAPHAELDTAWRLYTDLFGGFCGSHSDPQFWRHESPAQQLGTLTVDSGSTVVVVGTGPSLESQLPLVRQLRSHLILFTSPHGADILAGCRLLPDVVVVDQQTPTSARSSLGVHDGGLSPAIERCPLVAVNPRTPPELVAGVAPGRLFVPDPLPTWGLWPATAVALAIGAGARRVGLLGVDLGDGDAPDQQEWPLAGVLSLLAWIAGTPCVDCGQKGARKAGWPVASLEEIAADRRAVLPAIAQRPWLTAEERQDRDGARLHAIEPVIQRARALLALGLRARAGAGWAGDVRAIEHAVSEMLAWRVDQSLRVVLQDTLGLSVLPRLWRGSIDMGLGIELWRPIVLAAHELLHQADKLESRLSLRLCA